MQEVKKLLETQDIWGISSVGRASALHAEGQEFESPILQKIEHRLSSVFNFFVVLGGRERVYMEFEQAEQSHER